MGIGKSFVGGRTRNRVMGVAIASDEELRCDEMKPACRQCTLRSIAFDYVLGESSNTAEDHSEQLTLDGEYTYISSSQTDFKPPKRKHQRRKLPSLRSPQTEILEQRSLADRPFEFSILDMELFHNYMSSTSLSLGDDEASRQLLQNQLRRLAAELCAHGILLGMSPWHFTIALGYLIPSVTRLNPSTFHALYAASSFMCFCALGRGPQQGDYLAFSASGQAEWLTLLHGVRSIVETKDQMSIDMDTAPVSCPTEENGTERPEAASQSSMLFMESTPMTRVFSIPLDQIRYLIINELEQSDLRYAACWKVYEDSTSVFQSVKSQSYSRREKFPFIFGCLHRLPNVFTADLQEQRPLSLVIYARLFHSVIEGYL
ncbi:hypothetical protein N7501_011584 [Penicillium viridicatum]|nr:hypothetical protein N7501_011584 [Penicillium viridicatum]